MFFIDGTHGKRILYYIKTFMERSIAEMKGNEKVF